MRLRHLLDCCCTVTGVTAAEVQSHGRHPDVVRARELFVFCARDLTDCSFPEISTVIHRANHSTAITAHHRRVQAIMHEDTDEQVVFYRMVRAVRDMMPRRFQAVMETAPARLGGDDAARFLLGEVAA